MGYVVLQCNAAALSVLVAVWFFQAGATLAQDSICQNLGRSPTLTPFVDSLPIPPSITLTSAAITLGAYKITQKLHRDLAPTTLYAYGQSAATASFPGPTLEASQGTAANVNYENHIPDATHFLPLDRTIHWANPTLGGVPTVVHLHGAEVQSFFDGHPDAWFTQYNEHGQAYTTQSYTYPNSQRTSMLWYHDHTVGITRLNVLAGLAGIYFLRSSQEQQLTNMFTPGKYEIPFLIKDVQFWANGSINFPSIGDSPTNHPQWCPEYFGDTILVNGKAWPYLNITARWYRLRLVNGANARFFNLTLSNPNLSFIKIGTDGGFLDQPQTVSSLLIAPAERIDCLIDFSSLHPGDSVFVNNSAAAPFPSGNPAFSPPQTSSVAMFRVVTPPPSASAAQSRSSVMSAVSSAVGNNNSPTISYTNALHRYLVLQEFDDAADNPVISTLGNKTWTDPATELPKEGAVEVWELINTTPDAHPIHIHLVQFTVLSSQPYDVAGFLAGTCNVTIAFGQAGSCFTGPSQSPYIYQTGHKDTAIVWPGFVTRYGIRFSTASGANFPFDPALGPGYVWHCHILDHEDNDMMRPYNVTH